MLDFDILRSFSTYFPAKTLQNNSISIFSDMMMDKKLYIGCVVNILRTVLPSFRGLR